MSRNYLKEAVRIARGETLMVPEREHLQALHESRVLWMQIVAESDMAAALSAPVDPERRTA
jgi:hypothetical protein